MREATSCGSSARCAQAASGHRTWPPAPSPGSPAPGRSPAAADGHPRRVPARVGSAPWRRTATVRRRWPPLGWRWGASSMARVRPLSKAAAWWSRSSGVPSPSGAMAMTERVRPRTATWPELSFDLAFALSPGWPPAPATRPGRWPDSSRFCHAAIRMVLVALYLRAYDGRLDGFHGQIRASHAYSLPCSTAIYLGIRTPSRFLLRASTAPLVA
jgi:hypothetical protein